MIHYFDIELAEEFGLEESIILQNIHFWIQKNEANGKHFYEGCYWTYNSLEAWSELFPYLAPFEKPKEGKEPKRRTDKIQRILKSMEERGLIIKGNFNKALYDRTSWYCISAKCIMRIRKMDNAESQNGKCEIAPPIPDNKQHIENTDIKESKSHSVQFSEEENSHGESDSFSLSKNTGKKIKEPKDPDKPKEIWDKYRLTEKEYKTLITFHTGFCEEIDKHKKVRYDKNFNHLAGLYRDSGKKIETLKSVYSYFRTFRDFNDTFTLEIRSLRALREKYGKLIVECRKKTAEYIETRKTCILAVNHEKNYVVIYMNENISVSDQIKIASFVQSGYKIIDISPGIDPIDLKKIGYISSGGSKF